jgi:hypothetical protein
MMSLRLVTQKGISNKFFMILINFMGKKLDHITINITNMMLMEFINVWFVTKIYFHQKQNMTQDLAGLVSMTLFSEIN